SSSLGSTTCFCSSSLLLCHYVLPLVLPSFPTRRSSDLCSWADRLQMRTPDGARHEKPAEPHIPASTRTGIVHCPGGNGPCGHPRSEEHTSELQSRENLVCRLPLEKKNKTITIDVIYILF